MPRFAIEVTGGKLVISTALAVLTGQEPLEIVWCDILSSDNAVIMLFISLGAWKSVTQTGLALCTLEGGAFEALHACHRLPPSYLRMRSWYWIWELYTHSPFLCAYAILGIAFDSLRGVFNSICPTCEFVVYRAQSWSCIATTIVPSWASSDVP